MLLANNIRPNPAGNAPRIYPDAFIDPAAQIIGNVRIERDVFVGPLCVIRADERGIDGVVHPIIIGRDVNIKEHRYMGEAREAARRPCEDYLATARKPGCINDFNSYKKGR